jgi:site-specific recombinase XerD
VLKIRKRGETYHVDLVLGRIHKVRGSLGTQNRAAAMSLIYRLDIALSQGSQSPVWPELSRVIPVGTFTRFAKHAGVKEKYTQTWREFKKFYLSQRKLQVKPNTFESYLGTVEEFDRFVNEKQIEMLRDLQDEALIDEFKAWRADRIKPIRRRKPDEDCTLRLDVNHLHQMFKFAKDRELIEKNPVRFMAVPWNSGRSEKQPFTGEDMLAMRQHAEDDWFLFVLLKWTGFRRSDVASLVWQEVHFDRGEAGEIEKVCKKNGVRVILPLSEELRTALEAEYLCRSRRRLLEIARAGEIPAHPIGNGKRKTWRFRLSEIADAIVSEKSDRGSGERGTIKPGGSLAVPKGRGT